MLSSMKKLFRKGPSSPSCKDKGPPSPDSGDSSGKLSRGFRRRKASSDGYSSSGGKCSNAEAAPHNVPSNGRSDINQVFPLSPRGSGFDGYCSSQNESPRPAPVTKSVKSNTKTGTGRSKSEERNLQKVAERLGVPPNLLVDYPILETSGDYIGESATDSEDDQLITETPSTISHKSEIPSSFEFQRPPSDVAKDYGSDYEVRKSLRTTISESELQHMTSKSDQMPGSDDASRFSGEKLVGIYKPLTRATDRMGNVHSAKSLPEQVSNGYVNSMSPGRQSWMRCDVIRNSTADSRLSPSWSEEGSTETRYLGAPHYNSRAEQRRSTPLENGSPYRTGEELGPELNTRIPNKSTLQSLSPRSTNFLSHGLHSPKSQCSPRSRVVAAPSGWHSPDGRSCSSTSSSARGRQDWSDSNGSVSPQWGHNGNPSPDRCLRSEKSYPLPAPPPQSPPQHPLPPYVAPRAVQLNKYQDSPQQRQHREQRPATSSGSKVNPPSSPYFPVSPRPSPPRSPLPSSPRPLTIPYSPRSPLLGPSLTGYPSPPKSPSRPPKVPTKWKKIKEIGKGSFGTVYEAINMDDGSFFAVKVSHGETITPEIQKEIEVLSYLKHPNVVQYYGTGQEDGHLCIFLELMQNSLQCIIKQVESFDGEFFNEALISMYTRQILQGLEYLHSKNTIHRDIKCANILVDKDGQVKLADFGLSKEVGLNPVTSCKGTPYFMAPEILKPEKSGGSSKGYGLAVDIWSLGCTVIEMADGGKPPWSGAEGFSWFFNLLKRELPPLPPHLSPGCVDFIRSCLRFKPEDRPTASELLRHRFVANAPSTAFAPTTSVPIFPSYGSPSPTLILRNGYSNEARCLARPLVALQMLPSPPSPDHEPKVQRLWAISRIFKRKLATALVGHDSSQGNHQAPLTF
ncbi:hypothetical protein R1sor_016776 [Riccia sorocarpa]|uniref:mitogen-activated protein kinase kinase kinase n=1 Tax=Riccia sorocarpa TaxID=122646 RepID=A0ABD3HG16_9MARC